MVIVWSLRDLFGETIYQLDAHHRH